jgi:hypothetical protein
VIGHQGFRSQSVELGQAHGGLASVERQPLIELVKEHPNHTPIARIPRQEGQRWLGRKRRSRFGIDPAQSKVDH